MSQSFSSKSRTDPAVDEDRPFRHYSLKARFIAWVSLRFFDGVSYTVRHGLLKGLKRRGGLGWLPVGTRETPETRFWKQCNLRDLSVYDIGSFHGLLAMFFARQARTVVCFEPNSSNYARLMENLALNGIRNVMVRKIGVGSKRETQQMVSNPLAPGGARVDLQTAQNLPKENTRIIEEIPLTTLDEEIAEQQLPPPDFIKVDIEGWELEALRGARETLVRHRPALFLEMHGETLREKKRKVSEIVGFLWEIGYHDIRHVETGVAITPLNSVVAVEGHLYCLPQI